MAIKILKRAGELDMTARHQKTVEPKIFSALHGFL